MIQSQNSRIIIELQISSVSDEVCCVLVHAITLSLNSTDLITCVLGLNEGVCVCVCFEGVYGDVMRVKILFNKKENALVQMADATQAQLGKGALFYFSLTPMNCL